MPPRICTSPHSLAAPAVATLFWLLVPALPVFPIPVAAQTHQELTELFDEWRAFERPVFVDGVPDYSREAMSRQHEQLEGWQNRLRELDPSRWTVERQIDWHLVRAEMNGLDFDHRVRRPWARDPAFYVTIYPAESDVPAHEGSVIHGWVDLWMYEYPLSTADAAELAESVAADTRASGTSA